MYTCVTRINMGGLLYGAACVLPAFPLLLYFSSSSRTRLRGPVFRQLTNSLDGLNMYICISTPSSGRYNDNNESILKILFSNSKYAYTHVVLYIYPYIPIKPIHSLSMLIVNPLIQSNLHSPFIQNNRVFGLNFSSIVLNSVSSVMYANAPSTRIR